MQDKKSQMLGLIEAWSQKFNIPIEPMRERLKDVPSVEVHLTHDAPAVPAYTESEVRRACADLLPPE